MRIKSVAIIILLIALLWACSSAPKISSPPPNKIEAKGTISFKMVKGHLWRILDNGKEKFAIFPLPDCHLDLPAEDIKITPSSVTWKLRSDLLYVVRGYTGTPISMPDVGAIRRINANYIGTAK